MSADSARIPAGRLDEPKPTTRYVPRHPRTETGFELATPAWQPRNTSRVHISNCLRWNVMKRWMDDEEINRSVARLIEINERSSCEALSKLHRKLLSNIVKRVLKYWIILKARSPMNSVIVR